MRSLLLPLLLWTLSLLASADDSWSNCPPACKCNWVSGKKSADCSNASLTAIPASLSSEMQIVDLSYNNLALLPSEAFLSVKLVNVHKLKLRWCNINSVHKRAFANLSILTELDLSHNMITTLHPATFRDIARLTDLHLNYNPLRKLEDGLFNNLIYLQTVEVTDCQLFYVGHKTFLNVPKLKTLRLGNNNLTTMKVATFEYLDKTLRSLELYGNPWNCNCNLKPFIDWVVQRNLYTSPTGCQEPALLRGMSWVDLKADDLACRPYISVPTPVVEASEGYATLRCQSSGNPFPEMHWVFNSRIIASSDKHVLRESVDSVRWLNLTVVDVGWDDAGDYLCVAKSPGGIEERRVQLKLSTGDTGGGVVVEGGYDVGTLALIVGLAVGGAAFLVVVALALYCCCRGRRRRSKDPAARPAVNGDVQRSAGAHEEKFPLTAVNPVQKPPRRIERSLDPNGTGDCTDVECNLLDNGSTYKPSSMTDSDDRLEDHSMDSIDSFRGKSQDGLDAESLRSDGPHRAYPPDLLSFPPRAGGGQASPAASSASTAPDSSRLPLQSPAAQMPPPHLLFGTLPYSRSQSPFSPSSSLAQPRHHQGYVTIPRRPRVPSWGSAHEGLRLVEPVYDNLGPRTTADGSSMLSLNKSSEATTPMRGRPLPPPPIKEQPSPAPVHRLVAASPSPGAWSRTSPEGASLARRPLEHSTPIAAGQRTPLKVPPRPPPKPKKVVEVPSGPLFEDEGEDGTEV